MPRTSAMKRTVLTHQRWRKRIDIRKISLPVFKIEVWLFVEKNACHLQIRQIRPRADLLVNALDVILSVIPRPLVILSEAKDLIRRIEILSAAKDDSFIGG